jgi:hypothetical protein
MHLVNPPCKVLVAYVICNVFSYSSTHEMYRETRGIFLYLNNIYEVFQNINNTEFIYHTQHFLTKTDTIYNIRTEKLFEYAQ